MKNFRVSYDCPDKFKTRVHLEDPGELDELVLKSRDGKRVLLRLERMDTYDWWASIGDVRIGIRDSKAGISVTIERGEYGEAVGFTGCRGTDGELIQVEHKREPAKAKKRGRK